MKSQDLAKIYRYTEVLQMRVTGWEFSFGVRNSIMKYGAGFTKQNKKKLKLQGLKISEITISYTIDTSSH